MISLLRVVRYLPVSRGLRVEWRRVLLAKAYARDIDIARKAKNHDKAESLKSDHMYELQALEEEEDEQITKHLLRQARRLHVPTPKYKKEDNTDSENWYEGPLTYGKFLTAEGAKALREEIRKEQKGRHESRAIWIPWLSAVTGLLGAATGLIALLRKW